MHQEEAYGHIALVVRSSYLAIFQVVTLSFLAWYLNTIRSGACFLCCLNGRINSASAWWPVTKWRSTMARKKTATASLSFHKTSTSSEQLDFSSAEFNHIDDLDDNTGNYRAFHSLTGIVTADMRHHEQRRQSPSGVEETAIETGQEAEQESSEGEVKAVIPVLQAIQSNLPPPLSIVSKGRLLIIDSDLERALTCAERLSQKKIECTLCTPTHGSGGFAATNIDSFAFIEADSIAISGAFGSFVPTVRGADGMTSDLSTLTGQLSSATGRMATGFDLVLDLQGVPSYAYGLLPVGYYAPGEDPLLLEAALTELPEMRGRFKKPQFVVMNAGRCLHGWSHLESCRQCVDICPVAALTSENGMVVIDQYRCQGCAACALVCPTGAMQVPGPRREFLSRLEQSLHQATSSAQVPTRVIFHDLCSEETVPPTNQNNGSHELFFEVEEVGLIGVDVLLATLAYGVAAVVLTCDRTRTASIREALAGQLRLGAAIVEGLQLPEESLLFTERIDDLPSITLGAAGARAAPAGFTLDHDKRTLTRLAASHLQPQNGARQPVIELPVGASFGTIVVSASCSLCMACVGACAAGALVADGESPKLTQIESRCHQCGACKAACPEKCISLQPRLFCDIVAADVPRVLCEAEPFRCVVCGEPFASATMVGKMQEKLADHWMYNSDQQIRRLQMCRTCRTQDVFNAGDYQT